MSHSTKQCQCSHKDCTNKATKEIVFLISLKSECHSPLKAFPPIFACNDCATDVSATDIFSYEPGRKTLEESFSKIKLPPVDWDNSLAYWQDLAQ